MLDAQSVPIAIGPIGICKHRQRRRALPPFQLIFPGSGDDRTVLGTCAIFARRRLRNRWRRRSKMCRDNAHPDDEAQESRHFFIARDVKGEAFAQLCFVKIPRRQCACQGQRPVMGDVMLPGLNTAFAHNPDDMGCHFGFRIPANRDKQTADAAAHGVPDGNPRP